MRDIRFKGKHYNSDGIIEGDLTRGSHWYINGIIVEHDSIRQITPFADTDGKPIWEGDQIGDWVEVDGEQKQGCQTVFWSDEKGAWMLDESFHQNRTEACYLWEALNQFEYYKIKK